jgi:hypothetical protein
MFLAEQPATGDDAGSRAVLMDELGEVLQQLLDRRPHPGL